MIPVSGEPSTSGPSPPSALSESHPLLSSTPPPSPTRHSQREPTLPRKEKHPTHPAQTSSAYGTTAVGMSGTAIRRGPGSDHLDIQYDDPWRTHVWAMLVCLMAFCCIVTVLLLFFTPDFAQRSLDHGVRFSFQQASILNVSDNDRQGADTITLHILGKVSLQKSVYGLSQKIMWLFGDIDTKDAVLTVSRWVDTPHRVKHTSESIGIIRLPGLVLARDSRVTRLDFVSQFMVNNPEALAAFLQEAMVSKTVSWRLSGPIGMNIGWLVYNTKLNMDRRVVLEGMDGLKPARIRDIAFTGEHRLGGIAIRGRVGIYNPSKTLSMRLGNVNFGIFLPNTEGDDVMIAVVQATNVALLGHHENWFIISGRTLPLEGDDQEARRLLDDFLTNYVHGNTTTVLVRGSIMDPENNTNQTSLSATPEWLLKVLASLTLRVPFPGTKQTDMIKSLKFAHLNIEYARCGNMLVSGNAVTILRKPDEMRFPLNVTHVVPRVLFYLTKDAQEPFGRLAPQYPCPSTSAKLKKNKVKVVTRLHKVPFTVIPGKDEDFQRFIEDMLSGKNCKVYIRGTADANIDSAFGHVTLRDLPFQGEIDTNTSTPASFYSFRLP